MPRTLKASPCVLAALLALAATPAFAQAPAAPEKEPPPPVDPVTTIVRLDPDHHGFSTREAWIAYGNHPQGFTNIDADKDGKMTVAELRAFRIKVAKTDADRAMNAAETPKLDPAYTVLLADTDHDGAISEAEWVAYGNHGGAGFTPVDANHDGKVTAAELAAYRKAHP